MCIAYPVSIRVSSTIPPSISQSLRSRKLLRFPSFRVPQVCEVPVYNCAGYGNLHIRLTDSCNSVSVAPDCITKFNELKLNKKLKFIIYKLSDDYKEIVIEETSENGDWDVFREKLLKAESKNKMVRLQDPMFQVVIDT
jgi:hypothetical protein